MNIRKELSSRYVVRPYCGEPWIFETLKEANVKYKKERIGDPCLVIDKIKTITYIETERIK